MTINIIQSKLDLRFLRQKNYFWMVSTLLYNNKKSREILIKSYTKNFGYKVHLKYLLMNSIENQKLNTMKKLNNKNIKKVILEKDYLCWLKNNDISLSNDVLNKEQLFYINKYFILLLLLNKKPRKFFRLIASRKVPARFLQNYIKFNESISLYLKYKITPNILNILYKKHYIKTINKYYHHIKVIKPFIILLRQLIYLNTKYYFILKN